MLVSSTSMKAAIETTKAISHGLNCGRHTTDAGAVAALAVAARTGIARGLTIASAMVRNGCLFRTEPTNYPMRARNGRIQPLLRIRIAICNEGQRRLCKSSERRGQHQRVFDGSGVVARAAAGDFKTILLVKFERREIGSAHFEERLPGVKCRAPRYRLVQERCADPAASPLRGHREIEYFQIARHPPRDNESGKFARFLRDPPGHIALHHARVVPFGPLRDFWARRLDRQHEFHVARLDRSNVQVSFGAFQWSSASVRRT